MMARLYLILGILALGVFGYNQYLGNGLFDDTATQHSHGSAGRGTFHK